jgi:SAM-dependent methyltransferase
VLPYGLTSQALAAAAAEADPESLAASVRLRARFGPDIAAAAVTQVVLRRRAQAKFGEQAERMFFTPTGLEQATRAPVAEHHARRLVASGARRVLDLGCGIGADALAFSRAGLEVVAVERDPATAAVARANLAGAVEVVEGSVEELLDPLDGPGTAVFVDPARRAATGRSWRVADLNPSWAFVVGLFRRDTPTAIKLGPGLPRALIPDQVEAEWVCHHGDTVEVGLWSGPGSAPGRRSALVLPDARLVADPATAPMAVGEVGAYLYEPAGAVTRAGALPVLAGQLGAAVLHRDIVYLTADRPIETPFATAYRVLDRFRFTPAALRAWVRQHGVGALEIKTRGLDLDPARVRRTLGLRGRARATVVITRARSGRVVLVVERA